jgi:uncharacterized protein YjlB
MAEVSVLLSWEEYHISRKVIEFTLDHSHHDKVIVSFRNDARRQAGGAFFANLQVQLSNNIGVAAAVGCRV